MTYIAVGRFTKIFTIPEIRNKVLFVMGLLVLSRVLSAVPIPGVDTASLAAFLNNNQVFGLISTFTGGGLQNFSIAMLGVGPYITASIVMQLLTMIFPYLEQMYKYEGEAGRNRFNQYSRILTIPFSWIQGYAFIALLQRQGLVNDITGIKLLIALLVISAGSLLLVWLGELITEKNIGNGISLLIFAGIVSAIPQTIQNAFFSFTSADLLAYVAYAVIGLVVIAGVVFLTEAQRNVPVTYARRLRGRVMNAVSTYLPMRVNNAGVMPIIFALSLLLFPTMIAGYLVLSNIEIVSQVARFINSSLQNQLIYGVLFFILVVVFTFFYTVISFDPKSVAENMQKQGGYIPGIRPGPSTVSYLNDLLTRITFVGALFLGAIAVLPQIIQGVTGISTLTIGGTSLLIVVGVVMEMLKSLDAQISMHEY